MSPFPSTLTSLRLGRSYNAAQEQYWVALSAAACS